MTSPTHLVVRVRLHGDRFHGRPEWPPSPARLFQALVSAAGPELTPESVSALRALEALAAPVIAAPHIVEAAPLRTFVPNNDLDAEGGDPARVAEIRAQKDVRARILPAGAELVFGWSVASAAAGDIDQICQLVERVYQLGCGVDMASAHAALASVQELDVLLQAYPGQVLRPTPGGGTNPLSCPAVGSLDSLIARHAAQRGRLTHTGATRGVREHFRQPPKAVFRTVSYGAASARALFELRAPATATSRGVDAFRSVPSLRAHELTVAIRDAAAARYRAVGSAHTPAAAIDAVFLGRVAQDEAPPCAADRVRIVPLPSVGHPNADHAIRRVAVELPTTGVVAAEDVRWAFTGTQLPGSKWAGLTLVPADDASMLARYERSTRRWCTVTPVALPHGERSAPGWDSDPGGEAAAREFAIIQALRHAGVSGRVIGVRTSREPFLVRGHRTTEFAAPPRFDARRLWHVDLTFDRPVEGPLLLGDGRYLGLGVFAPVDAAPSIWAWLVAGADESGATATRDVCRAMKRAVLARCGDEWGRNALPRWISGHEDDGSPARTHRHLHYALDTARRLLVVQLPGGSGAAARDRETLDRALAGMSELRAGRSGLLRLEPVLLDRDDELVAPAGVWKSVTPYEVMRHARARSAVEAVEADFLAAVHAEGLPRPAELDVRVASPSDAAGLAAWIHVSFEHAVSGPIALGRNRHFGAGRFRGVE